MEKQNKEKLSDKAFARLALSYILGITYAPRRFTRTMQTE